MNMTEKFQKFKFRIIKKIIIITLIMSTTKKVLIMVLLGLIIYAIVSKQQLLKKLSISQISSFFSSPKTETFQISSLETKEEDAILLASPTLNPMEVKQLVNMKNTLIKPYTLLGTHPNTNQYHGISELDFKNLQAYIANTLNTVSNDGINYKIIPESITPNIFCATTTNLIFLTPIEIKGKVFINGNLFGEINLIFMLKGSTNSVYVPKNGVFFNNRKYEMYIDNITITSVKKNGANENKQNGFYATADNIDMMIRDNQLPQNSKTPKEIKLERNKENPLKTFTQLEDSEEDINLSEIIRDNTDQDIDNGSSNIEINY